MNYSEQLKSPKWQKKRLEIMQRDNFTCQLCGDKETTLNVHHIVYINNKKCWEYKNKDLITLCEHCHKEVEILKKDYKINNIEKISIYKSTEWENNLRIMFISVGFLIIKIYNSIDKLVVSLDFIDFVELKTISNMISKILKKGGLKNC
jgi:hypothetical protein